MAAAHAAQAGRCPWRGPCGCRTTARCGASVPPSRNPATARGPRRPSTSERVPERAPPGGRGRGWGLQGGVGWGLAEEKARPGLLSTATAVPGADPPPSTRCGLRVRPGDGGGGGRSCSGPRRAIREGVSPSALPDRALGPGPPAGSVPPSRQPRGTPPAARPRADPFPGEVGVSRG